MNNQDYGLYTDNIRLVCDGCSEGKHSEVGVKLFTQHYQKLLDMNFSSYVYILAKERYIEKLWREIFSLNVQSALDNLCFTILQVVKLSDNEFDVHVCGDGYIIVHHMDDSIEFIKLDNGEYPNYYIYNFIDSIEINPGFETYHYSGVKNVGVATDGLRFILQSKQNEGIFREKLLGKEIAMKRFLNTIEHSLKDDITISF
jgi:hypothetical protein